MPIFMGGRGSAEHLPTPWLKFQPLAQAPARSGSLHCSFALIGKPNRPSLVDY